MKKKHLITLLAILVSPLANANLVDLDPGGFVFTNGGGLPIGFDRLQTELFFDEAAFGTFDLPSGPTFIDGWVSQFGVLNGGQFFFTNLFQVSPTASALIWWNFNGAPNGDWLSTIDVFGRRADGTAVENIYAVPWGDRFLSPSDQTVTLDGITTIMGISFYGLNPATVPEQTDTAALLMLALSAILFTHLLLKHRTHTPQFMLKINGEVIEQRDRNLVCDNRNCLRTGNLHISRLKFE
jgi:hypothetical protein